MNLFSYIVKNDGGFAPNPFHRFCTLACCKPKIRQFANVDDIIVGLTPKGLGHKLVYAMRVTEKLSFKDYWSAPRFEEKKPAEQSKQGDNIYRPISNGFSQLPFVHGPKEKERDLGGQFVLASNENDFVYFGKEAVALPAALRKALSVGRGYRKFSEEDPDPEKARVVVEFKKLFKKLPRGKKGEPRDPEEDETRSCGRCSKARTPDHGQR
jgi:hypothetical protein